MASSLLPCLLADLGGACKGVQLFAPTVGLLRQARFWAREGLLIELEPGPARGS